MPKKIIGTNISFSLDDAKSAGGKTGSVRVEADHNAYQYKPPIYENSFKRKVKSNFLDKENFGEVLAARLLENLDYDKKNPRVPHVFFVTDPESSYVAIASQYLKGEQGATGEKASVKSLDDYLNKPEKKSHIKLVSGEGNSDKGIHNIDEAGPKGDKNLIKRELAKAIALSALVGDHDVNPGNMIVITDGNGRTRIGRIDYGHAFNDLMRFSNFGGKKIHDNNIIDFFNRETVDGLNSKSKLWRDYPGLVPSREMVNALNELSSRSKADKIIQKTLQQLKTEVLNIIKISTVDKEQVIRSFQQIAEHITGKNITPNLKDDERLTHIFEGFKLFITNNMRQMAYVAKIMDLQVSVREAINGMLEPTKLNKQLEILKLEYETLVGEKMLGLGPFSWIKEAVKSVPFKGNFDDYVAHIHKENDLNKINELITNSGPASEIEKYQKFQAIINNRQMSVEDKIVLLANEVNKIKSDPIPKSSWFNKILNAISMLFSSKKDELKQQDHSQDIEMTNTAVASFKARLRCIEQEEGDPEDEKGSFTI